MMTSSGARYGTVAQIFHWLTAAAVLAAFVYGLGGTEQQVYAVSRNFDRQLHETLGLLVFALVALRLIWRWFTRRPDPEPGSRRMALAATVVQVGLYALMLAVPVTAIAGAWLEGHPLALLGGVQIQPLVSASHDLGANIATIHTWLGDAIMWLAGFHALAAIYHHFVLKDGVLVSMLPRWLATYRPAR